MKKKNKPKHGFKYSPSSNCIGDRSCAHENKKTDNTNQEAKGMSVGWQKNNVTVLAYTLLSNSSKSYMQIITCSKGEKAAQIMSSNACTLAKVAVSSVAATITAALGYKVC